MNQAKSVIKQRQERLLEMITSRKHISVTEAANELQVSTLTIRRDLELLEARQLIIRHHGGATLSPSSEKTELHLDVKKALHGNIKDLIGQGTANLIPEGSTLFLNSGTTTLAVLKALNGKRVRVITNNALAPTVVTSESVELILTGGECRAKSKSLVGEYTTNIIRNVFSNYCILGANAIDASGTTTSVYAETQINTTMVSQCRGTVIVVADGSKVGEAYNFFSIPASKIDLLVTDASADPEALAQIKAAGIQVMMVEG